jgi:hypothetical protein
MARSVQITVVYPDGRPARGVRLRAHNNNASDQRVANWNGISGSDGTLTWRNLDTGMAGDHYQIDARYTDKDGIAWVGSLTERIFAVNPTQPETLGIRITLAEASLDEMHLPQLPEPVIARMRGDPDGRIILDRFVELDRAVQAKLTISPITLATSIIEGLLRVMAKRAGSWNPEWEEETFGALLGRPPIQALLPPAAVDRLRALNQLRKPAAHFKGENPLAAEATLALQIAQDLAEACYA